MIVDSHMHTYLCGHATGQPADFVRAAARQGIGLITFTAHIPMAREDLFRGRGIRMRMDEMDQYRELVAQAAGLGRELGVEVRYGIESEYYPVEEELHEMWDFLAKQPFDFVLGSLHHQLPGFRGWLLEQGGPAEIAAAYFRLVARALASGHYDSIAHPDLIRIYGTIPPFDPRSVEGPIRDMLQAAVDHDACLEVNTSGLIKQIHELHPAPTILEWAAEAGVKLTLGSDAHAPEQVGQKFDEVIPLLRQLGFTHIHAFQGRRREAIPLGEAV